MDWSLLETFLHVAEAGSSSAAAGRLGLSQPTVSRRVQALEQALGVTLFVRHARGLALTERGSQLLESTRELGARVDDMLRRASGMRETPRGEVRISVNEPLGLYVLTPELPRLHERYPDIEIELSIENSAADLTRREADIAVRMFEPRGADLIARKLGDVQLGFFASEQYLQRHGRPTTLSDIQGHRLIGSDRDPDFLRLLSSLQLRREDFALRTDSLVCQVQAMRAGLGIGGTHLTLAERFGLSRVFEQTHLPALPVWLVSHAELRTSAAVRSVFSFLEQVLGEYCGGARD